MRPARPFGKLGNRGLARLAMGLEASLVLPERTARGVVDNVSRVGCCLRLADPPRKGVTALARIEEVQALCTVIWVKGERCGLHFERELPAEEVERFRWIVEHHREHELSSLGAAWR
jgi:hypothetical protein